MGTDTMATKGNMDRHYRPGVFAYSPATGEEYSADPGDYADLRPEDALTDSLGGPMVLVTRMARIVGVR